ncbi:hypothetical protein SAEN111111_05425 [Saccharibacillus endophyticus]
MAADLVHRLVLAQVTVVSTGIDQHRGEKDRRIAGRGDHDILHRHVAALGRHLLLDAFHDLFRFDRADDPLHLVHVRHQMLLHVRDKGRRHAYRLLVVDR